MKKYILIFSLLISNLSYGQFSNITQIFAEIEINGVAVAGDVIGSYAGIDFTGETFLRAANIELGKVLTTNGQAGQTIQRPLVIKKHFDRASVFLIDAMTTNKTVDEITISFLSIDATTGFDILRFKYIVQNANILSIKHTELLNQLTGITEIVETLRLTFDMLEIEDSVNSTYTVIDNSSI